MPKCPSCRHSFRVLDDEDDGQHACPSCGYTGREHLCRLCGEQCDCGTPKPCDVCSICVEQQLAECDEADLSLL